LNFILGVVRVMLYFMLPRVSELYSPIVYNLVSVRLGKKTCPDFKIWTEYIVGNFNIKYISKTKGTNARSLVKPIVTKV